jgi:hypothetical protein
VNTQNLPARRAAQQGVVVPSDPITLGNVLAASGFFADSREGAQAAVKVMAGQELGFGPIASMTGIYIVKGRVTLSANLMAAAIKRHPAYTFRVTEHTATVCTIDFYEDGEKIGTSSFSMDDAKTAGLTGSETYKKFPKNMLYARALSNGAKWYCPDVFGGAIYTPDELGEEVDGETGEILNPTAPEPNPVEAEPVDAEVVGIPTGDAEQIVTRAADLGVLDKLPLAVGHVVGRDVIGDADPQTAVNRLAGQLTGEQAGRISHWLDTKAAEVTA